jgi:HAD superfamily hydrolase (TIGR01509 family)
MEMRTLPSAAPRSIECILFDSDGTLVDSEPLSFELLAEMLLAEGADLDPDALHLDFRGWKMGEVIDRLAAQHGLDLPADFEQAFRARQMTVFEEQLRPVPGVPELLDSLDLPMAVVTSGPMPKVRRALAITGLAAYFGDNIYSAYEVGVFKPDPGIYRHAAADMGYGITACLAIEDSPIGLEAAATCGAVAVFLNRYGEELPWDHVIEIASMSELPRVLARAGH